MEALKKLFTTLKSFNRSARLLLIATIFDGTMYSGWLLFFNFYILERGFDRKFLGIVNAMPAMGALLFGIPLGLFSDRFGRKKSMILGVGFSALCMSLQATVNDPTLIVVFAFFAGLCSMLYWISQAPFIMLVTDDSNRAMLFSLNFGLVTLSGAVGNLLAGNLPTLMSNIFNIRPGSAEAYQAVLLVSVLLSVFTLIPLSLIRIVEDKKFGSHGEQFPAFRNIIWQPMTLKLSFPNMLIGFGAAILIPYMNVFFLDKFTLSDKTLGSLFSMAALFTGIGSILAPSLVTKVGGKIKAVVLTQCFSVFFLLSLGLSPWLWIAAGSYLFRSTLMNMAVPLYHAFAMEQIREEIRGTVNSIMEISWEFGWTLGPFISGLVQDRYGFRPLFISTAILYSLANIFVWKFFHKEAR